MAEFVCKFVTETGDVVESTVEANSKYEIYETADSRGDMVLSVKERKVSLDLSGMLSRFKKMSPQEMEDFTTQLATILNAGVPLLSSLETLAEQAESEAMKNVIQGVAEELRKGSSLSDAMRKYPRTFSLMYANTIEAGEQTGVLDMILRRLSRFIGNEINVRDNIKSAIRYPAIIFSVLILAFTLAILFVIPRFASLYQTQHVELPLPTRILIGIHAAFTSYWFYSLISVLVLAAGVIYFIHTAPGIKTVDFVKLHVPVFKKIFLKGTLARFAHMLETLSRSGIPIISALETVEKTVGNVIISKDIASAREKVTQGVGLATALSTSKYFPKMTIRMINVGEQSGALDEMLDRVAAQFDREVDHIIKRLTTMIEPIMIIMMGGFMMLLALGIFMPMWKQYELF